MFKKGFTLAEVLITLSIIGFISALTVPALFQTTADAEIEPKLKKTQSAIFQASKSLLYDNNVDRISELSLFGADNDSILNSIGYIYQLCDYLKCTSSYKSGAIVYQVLSDGVSISFDSPLFHWDINTQSLPHKFRLGTYYIDINGEGAPNDIDKDIFIFNAYDDGSLRRE